MMKPGSFLLVLVALGVAAGAFFWIQGNPESAPAEAKKKLPLIPPSTMPGMADAPVPETAADLKKEITIMEGQVEYLQGQVKALQEENAELIQRLGTLGMKGQSLSDKPSTPALGSGDEPPDYVSLGVELLRLRKLQSVPLVTITAPQKDIEKLILDSLKRLYPGDAPALQSRALAALGVIPEPVDILPLKAALMVRQLGGWYDATSETVFLVDTSATPPPPSDPVMALAYAQLLRDHEGFLQTSDSEPRVTLDAQLAREGLFGGDAALTRFLYSIQKPINVGASDLPPEDPDHPFNEVPMPVFLRELHLFASSRGFEFAQSLHSVGGFQQITAAYGRPPLSSAEIIDPELYLNDQPVPVTKINWPETTIAGAKPYWTDTLGKYATYVMLRAHNPDEIAFDAAKGWRTDQLLCYTAGDKTRDHAVWQVSFPAASDARRFFKTLGASLLQRYDQPAQNTSDEKTLTFTAQDRSVRLALTTQGTHVLLIDSATPAFLTEAVQKFDPPSP
jgi:hypothetical protein